MNVTSLVESIAKPQLRAVVDGVSGVQHQGAWVPRQTAENFAHDAGLMVEGLRPTGRIDAVLHGADYQGAAPAIDALNGFRQQARAWDGTLGGLEQLRDEALRVGGMTRGLPARLRERVHGSTSLAALGQRLEDRAGAVDAVVDTARTEIRGIQPALSEARRALNGLPGFARERAAIDTVGEHLADVSRSGNVGELSTASTLQPLRQRLHEIRMSEPGGPEAYADELAHAAYLDRA